MFKSSLQKVADVFHMARNVGTCPDLSQNILSAESVSLRNKKKFHLQHFLFIFFHGEKSCHFSVTITKISLSESETVVPDPIGVIKKYFNSTIVVLEASIS